MRYYQYPFDIFVILNQLQAIDIFIITVSSYMIEQIFFLPYYMKVLLGMNTPATYICRGKPTNYNTVILKHCSLISDIQ